MSYYMLPLLRLHCTDSLVHILTKAETSSVVAATILGSQLESSLRSLLAIQEHQILLCNVQKALESSQSSYECALCPMVEYAVAHCTSNCTIIAKKIHHIMTQLVKIGSVIKQYMEHNLNFSKLVSDAGDKLRFRKSHDVEASIYEQIRTIISVASRFMDDNMVADVKKYISHFDVVKTPKKRVAGMETTTPDTCAPSDFVLFQKSPPFTTATSSGSVNSARSVEEDDDKSVLMDILATTVATSDTVISDSNAPTSARKKQKFNDSSNELSATASALGANPSQQSSQESDKGTLCDSNENYTANINNIRGSTQGSEEDVLVAPDFRTDSTGIDI